MISEIRYRIFLLLIVLVYLVGLVVTLFENDSAQFAVMAMRMVRENDFINLIKGTEEYLDKPHLHYWLAALSYLVFGIQDWAYRIPGVLVSLLGAYSCYGIGRQLYSQNAGKLAALIFLTAQTIVLSNIDMRTDAVLTGFTAFSIWQLVCYIDSEKTKNLLLGAVGAGLAFSTKGQIAILVIGLPIFCHLLYERKLKLLLNKRTLLGILAFVLVISPVLYAYYQQFDLHPEKVIRGRSGRSGVLFILWEQSFERLSGEGVGKNSSDYFFFFHTFLWVFLPWTILGLVAYGNRLKSLIKGKFKKSVGGGELLTVGGISLIFILISFAQFKLPHYLNITIPLFAVLTASYILNIKKHHNQRVLNWLLGGQVFVLCLVVLISIVLSIWVFKLESVPGYLILGVSVIAIIYIGFKKEDLIIRIITISAISSVFINTVMNAHFYPNLLEYQAGSGMSDIVKSENIPVDKIYKLSKRHTWSLDFYNREPLKIIDAIHLENQNDIWLYLSTDELTKLKGDGYIWDRQFSVNQFRITRLQARFLNPATRDGVLKQMHLVHLD